MRKLLEIKHSTPIPRRMRAIRKLRGMTQMELGIKAGIDDPQSASTRINQYERDTHTPNFGMVQQLAKALNVPAFYLYVEDKYLKKINNELFNKKERSLLKKL